MPAFRTILFAADFSASSCEAFVVACALAHEHKTRLILLHVVERMAVVEQPVAFGEAGGLIPLEGGQAHHEAIRARLAEIYAPSRPIEVEYVVCDGEPAEEVLRTAREFGADLIVMGTHGRTGLRRLLAGSVAEAVLRRAHCPVLALRAGEHPRGAERIRTILHPIELEAPSETALQAARSLARDHGARLVLAFVAPLDLMLNARSAVVLDIDEYRTALENIRARADGPDLKFPVEAQLARGDVAAEIFRLARETACDLIVMGTHGRRGLARVLMGSVAEAVLRGAPCPALAVKEQVTVPSGA